MSGLEGIDGLTAYASRVPAYHKLGNSIPADVNDANEILKLAKLDNWNITLEPLEAILADDASTHLKNRLVYRNNPLFEVDRVGEDGYNQKPRNLFGIVGGKYSSISNEELAAFGEQLLPGGRWETAGSLKNGTQVFMSLALDMETTIDEHGVSETIKYYLVIANHHDGKGRLQAFVTPFRPECTNSLNYGLKTASNKISFAHTHSIEERMSNANKTLNLALNYTENFKSYAVDMLDHKVDNADFYGIIKAAYPKPDEENKRGTTLWLKQVDTLMQVWEGPTLTQVTGTAYGALNALQEVEQWGRTVYDGNEENFWAAGAGFDANTNKEQERLKAVVESYVGV